MPEINTLIQKRKYLKLELLSNILKIIFKLSALILLSFVFSGLIAFNNISIGFFVGIFTLYTISEFALRYSYIKRKQLEYDHKASWSNYLIFFMTMIPLILLSLILYEEILKGISLIEMTDYLDSFSGFFFNNYILITLVIVAFYFLPKNFRLPNEVCDVQVSPLLKTFIFTALAGLVLTMLNFISLQILPEGFSLMNPIGLADSYYPIFACAFLILAVCAISYWATCDKKFINDESRSLIINQNIMRDNFVFMTQSFFEQSDEDKIYSYTPCLFESITEYRLNKNLDLSHAL